MVNITGIVLAIIALIGAVVSAFLIPYLVRKYGKEKILKAMANLEFIIKLGKTFSEAIEQMHPDWNGDEKLEEVLKNIETELIKYNIKFDYAEVRAAIEKAVFNFNNAILIAEAETDEVIDSSSIDNTDGTNNTYNTYDI